MASELAAMANRNGPHHTLPPRPPLSSHQSNSVPSTPHQHAREFRSHSRSPSPNIGLSLGSHSPRSVKSEASGPMTTLPKGRPTCKYETATFFSKRRMQYDIGDAPLEKPKEEPKKTLDPHEEKKLSGDMRELYDRLLPSEESDKRRLRFVEKLEGILRQQWPDTEFKVHIFGSSGNMLCTNESDVDICIQTPMKKLETMHQLADVLASNGMERVICIAAAKVPIVKIWDPELKLAADMNVNNTLALENTRMIKTYVQIDDRVRPLAMIVKDWTRQRILNDAGIGGTLSSYAWICMILNFLQTRKPPILPALHQMPHKEYKAQDGTESGFNDDLEKLRGFGSGNKETISQLLFHFFRFYAHELDYEKSVISVRYGKVLSRQEKGWDHTSKEGQWRLAIEEPFNSSRNLGNSADSTAFRGIHLEIRQAFEYLAHGAQLAKLLIPYEFPPEEKIIFKKPVSGPKPVLSAAIPPQHPSSRGGRGGGSIRGGRQNGPRQGNSYGRRSSSGASFGRHAYPPFLSPPIGVGSIDYLQLGSPPEEVARIQQQLLQQAQITGAQLEQLKAKFAFQEQQLRAQDHQRHAATLHAHSVAQGSKQNSQATSATASPQKTPYMTGTSSPRLSQPMIYPDYAYPAFPSYDGAPLSQSMSHDGSRTNPSSPSLAHALPRRPTQRSVLSGSPQGSASVRSQSQPARGMTPNFAMPPGYLQFGSMPGYGLAPYAVSSASQDLSSTSQSSHDGGSSNIDANLYRTPSLPVQDTTPKEYVGYYMPTMQAPPPTQAPQLPVFGSLPQIPQFSELAHRRNRPSQDLQLTLNGGRRPSRSPSPLGQGHQRAFSMQPMVGGNTPLRSAPLPRMHEKPGQSGELPKPPASGPAVANGSLLLPRTPEQQSTASDEDLVTTGEDANTGFSRKTPPFGARDALGLSGYQHSYGHDFRPQYPSMVYSPPHMQFTDSENAENLPPAYSPPQAFPPFFDPNSQAHGTAAPTKEEQITSPKSVQSPWTNQKPALPSLDTAKAAESHKKHGEPKTAPVLSPVYETRTPSPTATRQINHFKQNSINGIIVPNGETAKAPVPFINGAISMKEPVPPTPMHRAGLASSSGNGQPGSASEVVNGSGQWQQVEQPTKRKKARKRSKSASAKANSAASAGGGAASILKPQPMSVKEEERKGG